MYKLVRTYKNADLLIDETTQRVVAIANKMHNVISRACSMDELAKHFVINENSTVKYFGNFSEAFIDGDILVAKCIYTGRTVKLTVADNLFPLINAAVHDTWKLAQRINDFHTVNHKARDEMHAKMNNMFVTYAGRTDARHDNIMMLGIVKHVDPVGKSFTDLFNNLQEDNKPLELASMYDLLAGLAAATWPYDVHFDKTPELDAKISAFFNTEPQGGVVTAAMEFIKACATTNQRPITLGDAEYILRS